ncbi:MAG: hypothetical protein RL112_1778 [Planctomycetota bacterium]
MADAVQVVLDWHPARTHAPGIGRYLRELTRALGAQGACAEGVECRRLDWGRAVAADLPAGAQGAAERLPSRRVAWPRRLAGPASLLGAGPLAGTRAGLLHTARLDLWPRAAERVVLALSELPAQPAHDSELARKARAAGAIVVFTPLWRERAARTLGVELDRVHALPVGCEHWRRDLSSAPSRTEDVLVLGARRASPALEGLAQATAKLRVEGWRGRLVCAGRPGSADGPLRALDPRGEWLALVEPREVELPNLVASAGLLAYLQPDPGTPVTPLESLAMGTPLACLKSAVLADALGDAPGWVELSEAPDKGAWSRAIRAGLGSHPGAAAIELVRRHDWAGSAKAHRRLWSMLGFSAGMRRQAHGAS